MYVVIKHKNTSKKKKGFEVVLCLRRVNNGRLNIKSSSNWSSGVDLKTHKYSVVYMKSIRSWTGSRSSYQHGLIFIRIKVLPQHESATLRPRPLSHTLYSDCILRNKQTNKKFNVGMFSTCRQLLLQLGFTTLGGNLCQEVVFIYLF